MKETLTREEVERFNRVEVPLKNKIRFVIWFIAAMILLTIIGIWKNGGFRWS